MALPFRSGASDSYQSCPLKPAACHYAFFSFCTTLGYIEDSPAEVIALRNFSMKIVILATCSLFRYSLVFIANKTNVLTVLI